MLNNLKYLYKLLCSGVSFELAIEIMSQCESRNNKFEPIKRYLNEGHSCFFVLSYFFPWWCSYPFKFISFSIDLKSFLSMYLNYIDSKQKFLVKLVRLLMYPLVLLFFSIFILFFSIVYLKPLFLNVIDTSNNISEQLFYFYSFIFGLIALSIGILLYVFYQLLVNPMDVFAIVVIGLESGLSLSKIFEELTFNEMFKKKWELIYVDFLDTCSFSQSFCYHLNIPKSVEYLLSSYERSSSFLHGIKQSQLMYESVFFSQLVVKVKVVQFILYIAVVTLIIFIINMIYTPLFSGSQLG